MIQALAIIDDTRVIIYATIWSVIYDRKFTSLNLLEYRPLTDDEILTQDFFFPQNFLKILESKIETSFEIMAFLMKSFC
jgi:hypothetical protein